MAALPLHALPVRILAWDEEVAEMRLNLVDSKGSVPVSAMHPAKRTPIYNLSLGEKPPVVETPDRKDAEGKPFTSEIRIPSGMRQPLLVVLPDAKASSGIRLLVLEDDSTSFDWGNTRFINATGKELVFAYEKKAVAIPPSWNAVDANPGGSERNMEVKLFYRDRPERAFYSAIWEQKPDLRMLVFLVPGEDDRLGPVAFKMIPEDRRLLKAPMADP